MRRLRRMAVEGIEEGFAEAPDVARPHRHDEIIGRGLERQTQHTIVDPDALRTELDEIRERGYAFNIEESTNRLHAVGAPVTLPDGRVLGAISVSGPSHRMKGDRLEHEIPDLLLGIVNELELNIMYS